MLHILSLLTVTIELPPTNVFQTSYPIKTNSDLHGVHCISFIDIQFLITKNQTLV